MKLLVSPNALADLSEIWTYIAADHADAADRFIDEIHATCQMLATFPGMGRQRDELLPGIRSLPIHRYLIFYRSARKPSRSFAS